MIEGLNAQKSWNIVSRNEIPDKPRTLKARFVLQLKEKIHNEKYKRLYLLFEDIKASLRRLRFMTFPLQGSIHQTVN